MTSAKAAGDCDGGGAVLNWAGTSYGPQATSVLVRVSKQKYRWKFKLAIQGEETKSGAQSKDEVQLGRHALEKGKGFFQGIC